MEKKQAFKALTNSLKALFVLVVPFGWFRFAIPELINSHDDIFLTIAIFGSLAIAIITAVLAIEYYYSCITPASNSSNDKIDSQS